MLKELSVIIPMYNEARKIQQTISTTAKVLLDLGYQFEIMIINDGSNDESPGRAGQMSLQFPQVRVYNNQINLGKGKAVKEGMLYAKFPYVLFLDADNSTSMGEWEKFEKEFDKGARAVIASRHLPESKILRPQPFGRRFFGAGYRWIGRNWFGVRVSDFNCGFKAFETPLAKEVFAQVEMNDWTFDLEVLCRLKQAGVTPHEVPVTWMHEEKFSHAKLLPTIRKTLKSLLRLRRILGSAQTLDKV
jgi:glycosyltransferase involved in cell wall biosynthesis